MLNGSGRKASKQNQVKTTMLRLIRKQLRNQLLFAVEIGSVPEALKHKGRAKTQNSASKKRPLADTNKDFGVLELNEQLAAQNSSQVQPAVFSQASNTAFSPMCVDIQTNKSSTGTAAEISNIVTETKDPESDCLTIQGPTGEEITYGDNMDVNEEFEHQIASAVEWAMKRVGNPGSNGMEIEPNTSARQRATANKPQQETPSKELSSNGVKPVKSTGVSPEGKVRKTSTSSFMSEAGVVDSLPSWADYKSKREQKKADAAKRQRITGIPKLEDANDAGSADSQKCTLSLTEGDLAKALANEVKVEEARMRMRSKVMNGSGRKASRDATKNPHQNQVKKDNNVETNSKPVTKSVTLAVEIGRGVKRARRAVPCHFSYVPVVLRVGPGRVYLLNCAESCLF
ncbi:topoisomerase II [Actinidia rufa]|uniref:DNA topoisomerase (ATP-hydrolyzing) n=1 Tax=Actinidia rufa TaxID=165716 RepID=A0A7J0FC82_9ERIC|nr:topoisomerase II [Actinidia rufa]